MDSLLRTRITEILEAVVAEWLPQCQGLRLLINAGPCAEFAEDAEHALRTQIPELAGRIQILDAHAYCEECGYSRPQEYHTFLRIDDLYFDAEHTQGCDSPDSFDVMADVLAGRWDNEGEDDDDEDDEDDDEDE